MRLNETPQDLLEALEKHPQALVNWNALSPSHRNEYLTYIDEAKRLETRQKRILKSIQRLDS